MLSLVKIYENNEILKAVLEKTLSLIQKPVDNIIFINVSYPGFSNNGTPYPGMKYIINLRAEKKETTPVIFYGFDHFERLKKKQHASILGNSSIFYIQMPFQIADFEKTINKALSKKTSNEILDKKSLKTLAEEKIRALIHDCDNGMTYLSIPINKILNVSDSESVNEGKKTIMEFGKDFVEKKMKLFASMKSIIEKVFHKNKKILKIPDMLEEAEANYKLLCKETERNALDRKSSKVIVENGQNIVRLLQEIENILREVSQNGK